MKRRTREHDFWPRQRPASLARERTAISPLGLLLAWTFLLGALIVIPARGDSVDQAALSPEERGLEIAVTRDARDLGFDDFTAELTMTLRNRHGEESVRSLRSQTLEQINDGDKSLVVFDSPADIDGTALLTFSHKTGDDDQWLYLPALKRVKRISSSNKSGPFVGSEFAYEDISSQEVEEYTYKYLRDETVEIPDGGLGSGSTDEAGNGARSYDAFVIEQYPVDPKSGYTRQVAWIDKEEYRLLKVDFYDRKDALLKTLTSSGYQRYVGQYWRPDRMHMINHQTGKSTVLVWANYQFKNGLADVDFNRATLARAR